MNKIDLKKLVSYEKDFALWAMEQAALLRAGSFDRIDVPHLVEEIEDLAARVRSEIRSRLKVLVLHLLKYEMQPEKRPSASWQSTIKIQRIELDDVLNENPSLRAYPAEVLSRVYRSARAGAAGQTKKPESVFPEVCPYSIEQILDESFLPD
jgi:hypothetical protein